MCNHFRWLQRASFKKFSYELLFYTFYRFVKRWVFNILWIIFVFNLTHWLCSNYCFSMPKDEAQLYAADELYVFLFLYQQSLIIRLLHALGLRLWLIDILQLWKMLVLPQGTEIMVLQSWGAFGKNSCIWKRNIRVPRSKLVQNSQKGKSKICISWYLDLDCNWYVMFLLGGWLLQEHFVVQYEHMEKRPSLLQHWLQVGLFNY